uniref:Peptidase A2 domain-containing protein n=1 Tax=Laticauda laticaudata TaxID=8630 RepID=A0A8C5SKP5_LATLA
MVRLNIGGTPVIFLADTGTTRSVLTQPLTQTSHHTINIQGAMGNILQRPFLEPLVCTTKGQAITHQFVYMLDCPIPLLGRDLLCKLRGQISFEEDGTMKLGYRKVNLSIPLQEEWHLMKAREMEKGNDDKWKQFNVPQLWDEDNPPGYAAYHPPIIVEEMPMKVPVRIRQRAYPRHIMQAIQEIIDLYLKHHILVPTESQWNTPILPIPKGEGRFRPVQDLRVVNLATVTIYLVVPNPYVILGLIP